MHDRPTPEREVCSPLSTLRHAIEHAAHLLPAQGPITVFIHHNTLHAFEHLPFTEGVREGARVFDCEPFLPKDRYREALKSAGVTDRDTPSNERTQWRRIVDGLANKGVIAMRDDYCWPCNGA